MIPAFKINSKDILESNRSSQTAVGPIRSESRQLRRVERCPYPSGGSHEHGSSRPEAPRNTLLGSQVCLAGLTSPAAFLSLHESTEEGRMSFVGRIKHIHYSTETGVLLVKFEFNDVQHASLRIDRGSSLYCLPRQQRQVCSASDLLLVRDVKRQTWVEALVFDASSRYTNFTKTASTTTFEDIIEANRKLDSYVYPEDPLTQLGDEEERGEEEGVEEEGGENNRGVVEERGQDVVEGDPVVREEGGCEDSRGGSNYEIVERGDHEEVQQGVDPQVQTVAGMPSPLPPSNASTAPPAFTTTPDSTSSLVVKLRKPKGLAAATTVQSASTGIHTLFGTDYRSCDGFVAPLACILNHPSTAQGRRMSFVGRFFLPTEMHRLNFIKLRFEVSKEKHKWFHLVVLRDAIRNDHLWKHLRSGRASGWTEVLYVLRNVVRSHISPTAACLKYDTESRLDIIPFETGCRPEHVFAFNDAMDDDFSASSPCDSPGPTTAVP